MQLVLIQPSGLRDIWPQVLGSLCKVRTKGHCDWIAEDVYHAIKAGDAACHVAMTEQGYVGCLITTMTSAEFSNAQALHVWIAHSEGGDVFEAGLPMLRDMAKRAGVPRITFGSPRPGWAKRFPMINATYEVSLK
jgi:hypothetical protein